MEPINNVVNRAQAVAGKNLILVSKQQMVTDKRQTRIDSMKGKKGEMGKKNQKGENV